MKLFRDCNLNTRRLLGFLTMVVSVMAFLAGSASPVYAKTQKVVIGQATVGEKGKTYGTKPGDQSGYEVSTMNFTYHKGSWSQWSFVARANDAEAAKKIAKAAKQACKNNKIGYGKDGPSLYEAAREVNFNLSKIKKKVNCDCYELACTCAAAAGLDIWPPSLPYSDSFTVYTSKAYCTKAKKLQPGDILVTLTKKHRHVAIVISGPKKAKGGDPNPKSSYKKGAKYKLLTDQYTHIGAGTEYFYSKYNTLPANGKKLAVRDEEYAMIRSGTTVVCLESKRNWIRTSAGWIKGSSEGTSCVIRA